MKVSIEGTVRAYDVDGRGTATLSSLLHYAEESRLALAMALHARDVAYPLRNLARAQHLVIARPLPMLASFRATSHVTRIGGTSFDVATAIAIDGVLAASVLITFVVVDDEGKKTSVDERMRAIVVQEDAPRGPGLPEAPAPMTYERVYPVLPRDENSGRHVSHARLVEHAGEHLRLGAAAAKLDRAADARVASLSIVYEREARFPDVLRVAVGGATGTYDVTLGIDDGPLVARARFLTHTD